MKTQPYVPYVERSTARWIKVGELLGIPPDLAGEVYLQRFFTCMDPVDFQCWLENQPDAKEKILAIAQKITLPPPMSKEDEALLNELMEENNQKNYELKSIIEVGDEILADDTKTFLSGGEYITKGKWYQVLSLEERSNDGLVDFIGITTTNISNEKDYFGANSVTVLRRNGQVIWRRRK